MNWRMRVPLVNTCGAVSGVVNVKTVQRVRRSFAGCRLAVFSEMFHHGLLTSWLSPAPWHKPALRGGMPGVGPVWCEPNNGPSHNPCLAKYLAAPDWATSTARRFLNESTPTLPAGQRLVVAVHLRGLAAAKCGNKIQPARPCCIPTAENVVRRLRELGHTSSSAASATATDGLPRAPSVSSNNGGMAPAAGTNPPGARERPLVFLMVDGTRAMVDCAMAIVKLLGPGCCAMVDDKWVAIASAAGADSAPDVTGLLLDM